MSICNICNTEGCTPAYVSTENVAITSLSELRDGRTEVFFCATCGHLQSIPLPDLDDYYDAQYRILLDSEEEDQLYQVVDGEPIFRGQHQVDTLLRKIELPRGAKVLDYGCAKGTSAKRLAEMRPDLDVHLFDVSRMYVPFWEEFSPADRQATYDVPAAWMGQFHAVFSMYVAEHVADPVSFARQISSLLKPDGSLYWLVPNVAANVADFIVADHVNHFSEHSLMALMQRAGMRLREVDSRTHEAGLIVIADRQAHASSYRPQKGLTEWHAEVSAMSTYWSQLGMRIRQVEQRLPANEPVAIYGSGFYGTFIAASLKALSNVRCFLDQNPFRQGKELLGKPVVDPRQLAETIRTVYVGLNPLSARKIMEGMGTWRGRDLNYVFLE